MGHNAHRRNTVPGSAMAARNSTGEHLIRASHEGHLDGLSPAARRTEDILTLESEAGWHNLQAKRHDADAERHKVQAAEHRAKAQEAWESARALSQSGMIQ